VGHETLARLIMFLVLMKLEPYGECRLNYHGCQ